MAEYIKRDFVMKKIMATKWMDGHDGDMAMAIAASAPAADVAPVRHGWWVHEHISEGYAWVMCSECEAVIHKILINKRLNYCTNCGAKMDGGKNDGHQN